MLVDVFAKGITGKVAEAALDKAGITVNKNTIPFDTNSADGRVRHPHRHAGAHDARHEGSRDGRRSASSSRARSHAVENETDARRREARRAKLCERFPLYAARLAAYEKALARA